MHFLIDAQLPPALANWLEEHGHEAEHVAFALSPTSSDDAIADRARSIGAIGVSKDADFIAIVEAVGAPQLLLVRLGNVVNASLFARLDADWRQIEGALASGRLIAEVG